MTRRPEVKHHGPMQSITSSDIDCVASLEQMLVDFEAVIAGVSHDNVTIVGDCETLRTVERVRRRVDK